MQGKVHSHNHVAPELFLTCTVDFTRVIPERDLDQRLDMGSSLAPRKRRTSVWAACWPTAFTTVGFLGEWLYFYLNIVSTLPTIAFFYGKILLISSLWPTSQKSCGVPFQQHRLELQFVKYVFYVMHECICLTKNISGGVWWASRNTLPSHPDWNEMHVHVLSW